ncbi:biotin--[acetyl-CoA-carboxylase] ligase [Halopelagius longus]|uniref:Biotin--[acetyl-CoA-carboxylase] ligase n=1 Tax=Halopelagius longus TaxID=1236180 RepID=A0A1H0YVS6_9EURY|nr:biotin--[acetyl-CoA-carboxylase] ligase [Halopelagius longus]RDI72701.1 biotin--[acetyl-CoA-carboxylase] ligase [Halopelagius longus]SDQ19275.1 BirA family transcriptional regulator, biotin operon repressor / biotin-[acetyl-CoA-carboxylase] ligase [Halopelagius longus]
MNETRRALLDALADGPVAGPELADRLGVSRAAVWKQVEALREDGFGVESGDGGYRVTDVPEYGESAIAFGLDAPFEIEYHDSFGSTNDRARDLAVEGRSDIAIVTDEQTGARGRLERQWTAPSGGVWMSLLVRPDRPPAHVPVFTLAAAVATTRAAREAGVDAHIKWPNDVLVGDGGGPDAADSVATGRGGRKLAGVLTEMEGEADRVSWLIVGIGVNANVDTADLPPGATSIREEVGDVDRRAFVQRLLEEFHALRADTEAVLPAWREYASTLGRRVRVETPGGTVEGEAVDVRFPGALVVRTDDGEEVVHAGDCEHLRSA